MAFVNGAGVVSKRQGAAVSSRSRTVVSANIVDTVIKRAADDSKKVANAAALAAIAGSLMVPVAATALTRGDIQNLTYMQVKGTGTANRCPEVVASVKGNIKLDEGKVYKLVDLCLEPKSFQVEEEKTSRKGEVKREFVSTKLMTRATYTLAGVEGDLVAKGGKITFTEKDGIDYAATTVQLPGGERVPFLFTIKELVATSEGTGNTITNATEFGGDFVVPSYRTGLFLDPKGRGGVTGYDMAVALPAREADGAEGQDELFKETNKVFDVTDGSIEMAVNKIDPETKEIAGVFVSEQLSDTDMGAKAPKKILLKGVFYGRIED
mmetsp:Transcript_22134/g.89645  ORF Transcript_22134/g.89645 Transcript_22134/m.89645 type:complete len:323 (-) Transcript_22134:199-1167(-)|eukprot:CAMPEP_0113956250 /NCGR_PEP_ID=MMETSP0011_2-20120614/1935_1 /TAXON_ID=101924 /ORGANISM="Rhodosorus marinus" /LENGTH=322 /DNA_ID=CAMNT_0000966331 /DNA_START=107 /DNA_END=1075 /DNA_ORIENTATION=+ /assembly_acc=CAM_ASM_000156